MSTACLPQNIFDWFDLTHDTVDDSGRTTVCYYLSVNMSQFLPTDFPNITRKMYDHVWFFYRYIYILFSSEDRYEALLAKDICLKYQVDVKEDFFHCR